MDKQLHVEPWEGYRGPPVPECPVQHQTAELLVSCPSSDFSRTCNHLSHLVHVRLYRNNFVFDIIYIKRSSVPTLEQRVRVLRAVSEDLDSTGTCTGTCVEEEAVQNIIRSRSRSTIVHVRVNLMNVCVVEVVSILDLICRQIDLDLPTFVLPLGMKIDNAFTKEIVIHVSRF